MADNFTKELLKMVVAQICSTIGWHSVLQTPLEIMTDILDKHIRDVCKETKRNCELAGRTLPAVTDVHLALLQCNTSIQDISEYMDNVPPLKFQHKVPLYPLACESHLDIKELVQ